VSDGDEPPSASGKHNKRERLIPVRSTDFVERSRCAAGGIEAVFSLAPI
jgi:hypothetical protein